MQISYIAPQKLQPNPWNSNKVSAENMKKLTNSISELGFNGVVVVRENVAGDLEILGGQHRVQAAIDIGLETVPVFNVGAIDDIKAKKIGLADNGRYGTDDSIQLASILDDIGSVEEICSILPMQDEDLQVIMRAISLDLDDLDLEDEIENENAAEEVTESRKAEKPSKTHEVLSFRVTLRDAENIRKAIQRCIAEEKLDATETDEKTLAGSALSILLLAGE